MIRVVVMTDRKQRGVTLNAETYARFEQAAAAQGESVAAWLTRAGETRRRQEIAAATAAYCAQPEIAAQIAQYTDWATRDNAAFMAGLA